MFRVAAQLFLTLLVVVRPVASQRPDHPLVVVVFNRSGDAVGGALVDALEVENDSAHATHATTDSAGSATAILATGRRYRLTIRARSYGPVILATTATRWSPDTIRVTLVRTRCVVDVCHDAPRTSDHVVVLVSDSVPLAGAWVEFARIGPTPALMRRDTTGVDGSAGLDEPRSGDYRVSVRGLGRIPVIQSFSHDAAAFDTIRVAMRRGCLECGGRVPTRSTAPHDSLPPRAPEPTFPAVGGR